MHVDPDTWRYLTESPRSALIGFCALGVISGLTLIGLALGGVRAEGGKPGPNGEWAYKKLHGVAKGLKVVYRVFLFSLGLAIAGYSAWRLYPVLTVQELVVWTGLEADELRFLKETVVPGFKQRIWRERKRWVRVDVENEGWIKTLKALEDGTSVDVITFDVNGAKHRLISNDLIADLSECRELVPSSVHPTLLAASMIEGKRWFVPYRPNVRLLFVNKNKHKELLGLADVADSNAIEKLRTWTGVREFGESLRGMQREEGVVINVKDDDAALFLLELVWSAGGDPCDLSDPRTREAIEYLQGLWPCVSKESAQINWQTVSGYILSEKVAVARNWTMQLSDMHDAGARVALCFDVGLGWKWKGRSPVYLLGGECLALAKSCKNKELAEEFIRYLVSKEVQEKVVAELSWPAMRLDVLGKAEYWQQGFLDTINEALLCARPVPSDWYPVMAKIYEELFWHIVRSAEGCHDLDLDAHQSRIDRRDCEQCIEKDWSKLLEQNSRETGGTL